MRRTRIPRTRTDTLGHVQIMEGAVGSLTHAAPELLDSRGNTTQSDIYAFGVLMYEVISGKEPFKDCSVHDLIQAKTTTPTAKLLPMDPAEDPIHAAFAQVPAHNTPLPSFPCLRCQISPPCALCLFFLPTARACPPCLFPLPSCGPRCLGATDVG